MPDINSAFIAQYRAQGEGDRGEERVGSGGHNWCGKGDGMSKEDRSAFHFPGAVSLELISHERGERERERGRCVSSVSRASSLSLRGNNKRAFKLIQSVSFQATV